MKVSWFCLFIHIKNIYNLNCWISLPDTGGREERNSEIQDAKTGVDSQEGAEDRFTTGTAPDSPSKQLPDQISFFSGNPSVEIIHGIMHLYKTKWVSSGVFMTDVMRWTIGICIWALFIRSLSAKLQLIKVWCFLYWTPESTSNCM